MLLRRTTPQFMSCRVCVSVFCVQGRDQTPESSLSPGRSLICRKKSRRPVLCQRGENKNLKVLFAAVWTYFPCPHTEWSNPGAQRWFWVCICSRFCSWISWLSCPHTALSVCVCVCVCVCVLVCSGPVRVSSGGASCAGPGDRSGRSSGCRRRTWTVWLRCVSGSVGSARPIGRSASRSSPTYSGTASHLRRDEDGRQQSTGHHDDNVWFYIKTVN